MRLRPASRCLTQRSPRTQGGVAATKSFKPFLPRSHGAPSAAEPQPKESGWKEPGVRRRTFGKNSESESPEFRRSESPPMPCLGILLRLFAAKIPRSDWPSSGSRNARSKTSFCGIVSRRSEAEEDRSQTAGIKAWKKYLKPRPGPEQLSTLCFLCYLLFKTP